jgi:3-oxoacyl-[acyl-carrier-protein] synthase III
VAEEERYDEAEWDLLEPDEQAQAIVDYSLGRVEELQLDADKVAQTMNSIAETTGADPVTSLAAAVEAHDLTGLDETQAAQKIGEREGWT